MTVIEVKIGYFSSIDISKEMVDYFGGEDYIKKVNNTAEHRLRECKKLGLKGKKTGNGAYKFTGQLNGSVDSCMKMAKEIFESGFAVYDDTDENIIFLKNINA